MSKLVDVMLAVNDTNGNFTNRVTSIQLFDMKFDSDTNVRCYRLDEENKIIIYSRVFPIQAYNTYVGNICWDCIAVTEKIALDILNYLLLYKELWSLEEAPTPLWQKWQDNEEFNQWGVSEQKAEK